MKQTTYSMPFRWFVGLLMDADVCDVTGFTSNRKRLVQGDTGRIHAAKPAYFF